MANLFTDSGLYGMDSHGPQRMNAIDFVEILDWHVFTTVRWIGMKFGSDIMLRMSCHHLNTLTFPVGSSSGQFEIPQYID